jgi:hypothetical protein
VDNFRIYPIDILYARVDTTVMTTTTAELIESLKSMTVEQRMETLRASRPDLFQVKAPVVSFGKAPKDGWKDEDRVK